MKITKSVFLSFANTNSATASISVPFKVSKIHCKGIGYTPGTQPAGGAAVYGVISSDLVDNQPLGLFFNDSTYSYATAKDMDLTLYTPRSINGTYTFYLQGKTGAVYSTVGGGTDNVILILEFNDESEIM
jgi:hypothetical protein